MLGQTVCMESGFRYNGKGNLVVRSLAKEQQVNNGSHHMPDMPKHSDSPIAMDTSTSTESLIPTTSSNSPVYNLMKAIESEMIGSEGLAFLSLPDGLKNKGKETLVQSYGAT